MVQNFFFDDIESAVPNFLRKHCKYLGYELIFDFDVCILYIYIGRHTLCNLSV